MMDARRSQFLQTTGALAGEFNIVLAEDGRLQRGALPETCRQARLGL